MPNFFDYFFDPADLAGRRKQMGVEEANRTNLEWAKKMVDYQTLMSNTAHQREAEDMKRAGLNRILAASRPGASVPSGVEYKATPETQSAEAMSELPGKVLGAMTGFGAVATSAANRQKIAADTKVAQYQPQQMHAEIMKKGAETVLTNAKAQETINNLPYSEARSKIANTLVESEASNARMLKRQADLDRALAPVDAFLKRIELGVPGFVKTKKGGETDGAVPGWGTRSPN